MSRRTLSILWLFASTAQAAGSTVVQDWARARAREFEGEERGSSREGPLWRERPAGSSVLPQSFMPPTSLAPLVRAVSPGVVNVSAYADSPEVPPESLSGTGEHSLGSGFVLGPDGYVVTNHHVVEDARRILVRLADGRELPAEVVGKDPSTDLALLKLTGESVRELPFVYLGDSDRLEVGDWVVAIGNPFGFDHSVSHGIISAKERVLGVGAFDDFIQTDVSMNPGNSGGPLFNMRGEVVGVNTAMVSHGQGIGFAVPINMVKDLLPNLKVNGRLARGWLGLTIAEPASAAEAAKKGAVVKDVYAGSPAMEGGLRDGDRILAVNARPVESYLQLLRKVALLAPGSQMRLTVQRANQLRELSVRVSERPTPQSGQAVAGLGNVEAFGLILQDVDGDLAAKLKVPPYHGVFVSGVVPGSAAQTAGIRQGDLIRELNKKRVEDVHAFNEALDRRKVMQTVQIAVERGSETRVFTVNSEESAPAP